MLSLLPIRSKYYDEENRDQMQMAWDSFCSSLDSQPIWEDRFEFTWDFCTTFLWFSLFIWFLFQSTFFSPTFFSINSSSFQLSYSRGNWAYHEASGTKCFHSPEYRDECFLAFVYDHGNCRYSCYTWIERYLEIISFSFPEPTSFEELRVCCGGRGLF